jgi:hypothetical protein
MISSRLLLPVAAATLALTACEARIGNEAAANRSGGSGNVSAEGKAKDGELSVQAPGFEMKISIPDSVQREMHGDGNDDLLPPNATVGGIHVEGGRDDADNGHGQVELTFTSAELPNALLRWYQDPARAADFRVQAVNRQGAALVIAGIGSDGDGIFRVALSPRAGGGSDGRILLSDRN